MNIHRILAVFLFVATACTTAWSAPITAYVAEFNVIGVGRPEEMKTTIQNLLLSRLASDKVVTVNKAEGAAIKITGSYLQSGAVFSLDATAMNSSGAVITRAFTQGMSADEFIPAVGTLAKSLSEGIGKGVVVTAVPMIQSPVLPADVIKPVPTVSATGQIVQKIDGVMSGLAVGRTLPDGERELFMVGLHVLRYYRQGTALKLMAEIPYKVYETVLAVDSADLDNDSIPEIYVTIANGAALVSEVWKVEGTSLKKIAGPLPYYFRVVKGSDNVKKLYAQQMSGLADFAGDVSEMVKTGDTYALKNPVKLPKEGYLYNFNTVKGANGLTNSVITDRSGYLRIFSAVGEELWKSSEEYSGSETSVKRLDPRSEGGFRQTYFDQRIVVKANGELLLPKNSGSWYQLSKHSYSKNSLYCFAWDGSNLEEKWHTKQNDYYLADFAYDDNSRELLMLEIVSRDDGVFFKGASRLVTKKIE